MPNKHCDRNIIPELLRIFVSVNSKVHPLKVMSSTIRKKIFFQKPGKK